jgi:hypothetical protein
VVVHAEDVQKRRFACSGRPHDGNEVALSHLEIDIAQDEKEFPFRERIGAFDMPELDHRLGIVT